MIISLRRAILSLNSIRLLRTLIIQQSTFLATLFYWNPANWLPYSLNVDWLIPVLYAIEPRLRYDDTKCEAVFNSIHSFSKSRRTTERRYHLEVNTTKRNDKRNDSYNLSHYYISYAARTECCLLLHEFNVSRFSSKYIMVLKDN